MRPIKIEDDCVMFSKLTGREQQVLKLVSEGLTNREISEQIYLVERTVQNYMSSIIQKLNVRNRLEAVLLAQKIEIAMNDLDPTYDLPRRIDDG